MMNVYSLLENLSSSFARIYSSAALSSFIFVNFFTIMLQKMLFASIYKEEGRPENYFLRRPYPMVCALARFFACFNTRITKYSAHSLNLLLTYSELIRALQVSSLFYLTILIQVCQLLCTKIVIKIFTCPNDTPASLLSARG